MLIKTKRSRSYTTFQNTKGVSVDKLKKQVERQQRSYQKFRSQSQTKLQLPNRHPRKLQSLSPNPPLKQPQPKQYQLPNIATGHKPKLTLSNKSAKKFFKLDSLIIKLQNKTCLQQIAPAQGYVYLDISGLNCSLNSGGDFQILVQKGGVILENLGNDGESQFYQIRKFGKILGICGKIREIQFFRNLEKTKFFSLWKNFVKESRIQKTKGRIEPFINSVYSERLLDIRKYIFQIRVNKFIQPPKNIPITLKEYRQYLEVGCTATFNHLEAEFLSTVVKKSIEALEYEIIMNKERIELMYRDLNQSSSDNRIKLKSIKPLSRNLISQEQKSNKRFYLNYDEVIRKFTVFFRKVMYFLADFSIYLFKNVLSEVEQDLKKTHQEYLQRKPLYIQYLSSFQKKIYELQGPKNQRKKITKNSIQQIFMFQVSEIELIKIQFSLDNNLINSIYESSNQIQQIFKEYADFVKKVLEKQNVLDFQGVQETQREIFKEVSAKIDQYRLNNFLKDLQEYRNFKNQLPKLLLLAANETEQILAYITPIVEQINQFIKQGQQMMPKNQSLVQTPTKKHYQRRNALLANSTTDAESRKKFQQQKSSLLNFFQRKANLLAKMQKLPNSLNISIYCVSLETIKKQFQFKIVVIENEIKRFVPESFDKIADEMFTKLAEIDKKILIYNWTIEEFVQSAKGQIEYNQLNNSGSIFRCTEALNKFLVILSQVSEYLYKQKSLKILKVKSQIKRLANKIQQFDSRKIQKLKDFNNSVIVLKQQIWRQLSKIQNQIHQKLNKQHNDILEIVDFFPQIQEKLEKTKNKIDNATFIENMRFQSSLSMDKPTQFASYIKLKNDSDLLREFIEKYIEIKEKIERVYQEPLKSKTTLQIVQDINQAINDCRIVQQSLIPYLVLINQIKAEYYEYQLFFQTANQISYLEQEQLEQIENKKYFDFSKKKKYCIRDLYNYKLHEKHSQLSLVFLRKYYKRVLSDLIVEFQDFIQRKSLTMEIQVIKYIKDQQVGKSKEEISSRSIENQSFLKSQHSFDIDKIVQNSDMQISQSDKKNATIYKNPKRRSALIQATSTQKIPIFSTIGQYKCVLIDLEMQLNQLRNTCESISQGSFKEESNQISNQIKMLIGLFTQLLEEQESYIQLLKHGCFKGSPFFQDIAASLEEAKYIWSSFITGLYGYKSLAYIMKNYKQFKRSVNSFKKLLSRINSTIQTKIQDRRKQLSLLYLCSNSTVLKIIQNPLYFVYEFYSSVDEICLDPENSCLFIETFYKEEFKVIFKNKSNMQLNKIRQEISRHIKLRCYFNLKDSFISHLKSKNKVFVPSSSKNQSAPHHDSQSKNNKSDRTAIASMKKAGKQLIQISYLCYYIDMQFALENKDEAQITKTINKQIEYLTTQYENLHSYYENMLLKIDTLLSLCLELRSRGRKGQEDLIGHCLAYSVQLKEENVITTNLLKETFKNVLNEKKLERKRNSIEDTHKFEAIVSQAQEAFQCSTNFVINQQKIETKKVNSGRKSSILITSNESKKKFENDSNQQPNLQINTQKKRLQFNSFKVKLCNYFHTIQLSYDLIDPKSLVHYISSQRMLLSLFNSFYDPMKPTIVQDQQPINSLSCRLFRLYRKINYSSQSIQMSSNLLLNCVKLGKMTIAFCLEEENQDMVKKICSFLSDNNKKYYNQILCLNTSFKVGDRTQFSLQKDSTQLRIPNTFVVNNKKLYDQSIKTTKQQYRAISLQIPFMQQILQMFIVSLTSRYSVKIMKIVLDYIKVYQFFYLETKGEKMNIEKSKEMLLHILEQIQIVLSKEYKECFRNCLEEAINHKIQLILSLPLYSLGLKQKQVTLILQKFLDRLCKSTQLNQSRMSRVSEQIVLNEQQKKSTDSKVKGLNLQKQLSFMLSPIFQSRFGDHGKMIALIGNAGIGKSYCVKECLGVLPEKVQVQFINVKLYDEYTQFLITVQTIQQLRSKLTQIYDNEIKSMRRNSSYHVKYQKRQKMLIVYQGFEGIKSRRVVQLCELLIDPEETNENKVKNIIQMKNLRHLCPRLLSNLNILSFNNMEFNHETYLVEIQEVVASLWMPQNAEHMKKSNTSDDRITQKMTQSSTTPPNKNTLQKPTLKQILKLLPQIYQKLINQSQESTKKKPTKIPQLNMKICVSERQFYLMLSSLFTSYIYKNQKKWRNLINTKLMNTVTSIKRIMAFSLYWTFYYTLADPKSRSGLYEKLFEIKQFQQLYNPTSETPSSTISSLNSLNNNQFHCMAELSLAPQFFGPKMIAQQSLQNKTLEFTDDGVIFVKNKIYHFIDEDNLPLPNLIQNFHDFLYIETPEIRNLNKVCRILLHSKDSSKGIYVLGEKCSGKSKFIQSFIQQLKEDLTSSQSESLKKINRILDMQVKDHHNSSPQRLKKQKSTLQTKHKNQSNHFQLLFNLNQKNKTSSSSTSVRELSRRLFRLSSNSNVMSRQSFNTLKMFNYDSEVCNSLIYVDDCSLCPEESLRGSIVHQFLKNMCESNYFLFNEEIITLANFHIFYESRVASRKEQTAQLLAQKWFMFPIFFSFHEDYLPKIFEALIRNSLNLGVMHKENLCQLSSKTIGPENIIGQTKAVRSQQQVLIQSLMSSIKYLKQKSEVFESPTGQILSKNRNKQSSMLKKPNTWLYQFNFKNIYNTLYEFLNLLKSNQNNKGIKSSSDKVSVKYGDLSSLLPNAYHQAQRTFNSNFQVLETMLIFNLTSRLKSQHQDFYSLANLRQKKLTLSRLNSNKQKKKENQQIYRKYRQSSIFCGENEIDFLAQKLSEKRSLRKPILFSQFRENLYKFQYAIKTSRFILVNRNQMFDGSNFIDTASELLNLKIYKVEGLAYDFDGTMSRLSKMQKTRHTCVYIPLQTLYSSPQILKSIQQQIKIVYNLNDISANFIHEGPQPGSIKDISSDGPSYFSTLKMADRNVEVKDYQFTYVVEYPSVFDVAALPFIGNRLILSYACILWFQSVTASSKYEGNTGSSMNKKSEIAIKSQKIDQQYCLQLLRKTGKNKNNITIEYLSQIYPKKSRQKIEQFTRIVQKLFQNLQKQFKNIFPPPIYALLFSYPNYLQACRNCIDIYSRSETETNNRIKSIQSALSSLEFLFRDYENMRCQYLNLVRDCKEVENKITAINQQIQSKRKVIQQYISSGDQEQQKLMHKKCRENEEEIININKKTEEYRVLAMKNYEQINRTEIAQLKYLLNSSFEIYQEQFQLIAIVLGEQIPPQSTASNPSNHLYKQTLRKCLTDVNMMTKLKEQGLLETKSEEVIKLLLEKLKKIDDKDSDKQKASFMKNIYGWIKYSVKLTIFANAKKAATIKLNKQIEEAKDKIVQIYEKYKVENSMALINRLEKEAIEKNSKLKVLITQSDRQSVKLAKCAELVQKFRQFEKLCLLKLQDFNLRMKNYLSDSLIATMECCLTFSMPFQYRNDFRGKYEKIIEKILAQRYKLQKRVQTDLIEVDLKNLNKFKENERYCITNHTPFFFTNQRKRLISTILRFCCSQSASHRKLTIIDPHHIFLRQFAMVTDLSYIFLTLEQLNHPNISKLIEDINMIFIMTPPAEWTLQFIKPEAEDQYILDINNYRIKWNKIQVKLTKMQRCIILKESVQNFNDLAQQTHNIIYYDLQTQQQNQKIVQKILRSLHYRDYCSLAQKKIPQLKPYFQSLPQKSEVIKQSCVQLIQKQDKSMHSLIQQICKNSSNFGLSRLSHVSQLCNKIDSFIKEVNKCNQLSSIIEEVTNCVYFEAGTNKYLDEFSKQKCRTDPKPAQSTQKRKKSIRKNSPTLTSNLAPSSNPPSRDHKNSILSINTIKQLSRLIALSFEIVRKLMDKVQVPAVADCIATDQMLESQNKELFFTSSYVQRIQQKISACPTPNSNKCNSIKTSNYDISILKSAIQSSFQYAIEQTNLQSHKYRNHSQQNPNRLSTFSSTHDSPHNHTLSLTNSHTHSHPHHQANSNAIVLNMLKFMFNFLLIGVDDKYEFYYLLQLKSRQIYGERRSGMELPEEFFKLITLSRYVVEEEVKMYQGVKYRQETNQDISANNNNQNGNSQVDSLRTENQLTDNVSGEIGQNTSTNLETVVNTRQRQHRTSIFQKKRKSSLNINSQLFLSPNKKQSGLPPPMPQPPKPPKSSQITRMPISWQYSRTKQKYNSTNYINSIYEKAYENIQKLIKKSIAEGKKGKQELLLDIRRVIEDQKEISELEKLDLYGCFDRSWLRGELLRRGLDNMARFQLVKPDHNISTSGYGHMSSKRQQSKDKDSPKQPKQQQKQSQHYLTPNTNPNQYTYSSLNPNHNNNHNHNQNMPKNTNKLIQSNNIISSYVLPQIGRGVGKNNKNTERYQNSKNKGHRVKGRHHSLFCSVEDMNEMNFILEVMRFKNKEIEDGIILNLSAGQQQPTPEQPQPQPYYLIYQPTISNYHLSIKQLQQLYESIDWPYKVFVVVFTEEYWLKEMLRDESEKNVGKFLYGDRNLGDGDSKKNRNSLETNINNESDKKPLQQLKHLLKKSSIILSTTKQYYSQYPYRKSKPNPYLAQYSHNLINKNQQPSVNGLDSNWQSQISLLQYQISNQRVQNMFISKTKYHINSTQLILLISQCQNPNPTPTPPIPNHHSNSNSHPQHRHTNTTDLLTTLTYNTINRKCIEKMSMRELKIVKKYRLMIQRSMKMMGCMDRVRCLWEYDRFVESVVGMETVVAGLSIERSAILEQLRSRTASISRCIQTIFLPKLPLKLRNYSNLTTLTHCLPLQKIHQLLLKPLLPHTKLNIFDLDTATSTTACTSSLNSMKSIQYLNNHLEVLKMLSTSMNKFIGGLDGKYGGELWADGTRKGRDSSDHTRRSNSRKYQKDRNQRNSQEALQSQYFIKQPHHQQPSCSATPTSSSNINPNQPLNTNTTSNSNPSNPNFNPNININININSNTNTTNSNSNCNTNNNNNSNSNPNILSVTKSSLSSINTMKQFQLQNCHIDIMNKAHKILNWMKIYNREFLLGNDCYNYVRVIGEATGNAGNRAIGNGDAGNLDWFMGFGNLIEMVRGLVAKLENYVIWKQYTDKIYVDNFRVPISKHLLKSAIPPQIKLLLQSPNMRPVSPPHPKQKSHQHEHSLKLCKVNKIFSNQSLLDRIETNQMEFRIVPQEHKNVTTVQVEMMNKGRSGFYQQRVSIMNSGFNMNGYGGLSTPNPNYNHRSSIYLNKPNPQDNSDTNSELTPQSETETEVDNPNSNPCKNEKSMCLAYPLLNNDNQSEIGSFYNYNYNELCATMFRVQIDKNYVDQLLWKN